MAARRVRLRSQGLRPVQHWVPDLRDPKVRADLRRQAKLMARHPESDAIDDWIEAAYDWSGWRSCPVNWDGHGPALLFRPTNSPRGFRQSSSAQSHQTFRTICR
jgi:hypothetical protein